MRGIGLRPGPAVVAIILAALAPLIGASGEEPRSSLERDVLPLFKARCLKCHGPIKPKGKLNLSSARSLARGGSSGSVIVPGKPDESQLWDLVSNDEMPPEPEEPLAAGEKALLRRWIEQGASNLPEPAEVRQAAPGTDHWAFATSGSTITARGARPEPRPHPGRSFHPEGTRGSGLDPRSRRGSSDLDPPPQLRPDRPAAAARGDRGVRC